MTVTTKILSWKDRTTHIINPEQKDEFGYLSPFTEFIIFYQLNQWKIPNVEITYTFDTRTKTTFLYDETLANIQHALYGEKFEKQETDRINRKNNE